MDGPFRMAVVSINEGINSSVVVTDRGRPLLALQEERVRRVKNWMGFPHEALDFALDHLGLGAEDVEAVCLSNLVSPRFTKEEFFRWYDHTADRSLRSAFEGDFSRSGGRALKRVAEPLLARRSGGWMPAELARHGLERKPLRRFHHHLNHAASAYYGRRSDPDAPHLVLTLDGGGDGDCAHVYRAEAGKLELLASTPGDHSLGHIYARVTHMMGMTPHEHEYKLMGLAPYADPGHVEPLVVRLRDYLDLDAANPLCFKRKTREPTYLVQPRLERDFRRARFDSLAGAIQQFAEELLTRWVRECVRVTGIPRVLAAGGVFMNVKANKLIAELDEVEFFDVFPSCGDESLPFGAAWLHEGDGPGLQTYALGPDATFDLDDARSRYSGRVEVEQLADPEARCAELIADGRIVARCAGPMEFGARALGNRSILADPANRDVVPVINHMIKQRDFWMPFAPAVLAEDARDYVEIAAALPQDDPSPFMMHTFDSTGRRREFLAAIHPNDVTARAQTVSPVAAPSFHRILSEYRKRTSRAIVLNTSFNLHGFPIVMGACDAIDVMLNSSLEYLVLEDQLVTKKR